MRSGSSPIKLPPRTRWRGFCAEEHVSSLPRETSIWPQRDSERMELTWLLSSQEFIAEAVQNKSGKNRGKRSLWFNGTRRNKQAGTVEEYCKDRYLKYVVENFGRLREAR